MTLRVLIEKLNENYSDGKFKEYSFFKFLGNFLFLFFKISKKLEYKFQVALDYHAEYLFTKYLYEYIIANPDWHGIKHKSCKYYDIFEIEFTNFQIVFFKHGYSGADYFAVFYKDDCLVSGWHKYKNIYYDKLNDIFIQKIK